MAATMQDSRDLPEGARFHSRNRMRTGSVGRVLGKGGQGTVYEVEMEGSPFALKWYHDYYIDLDTNLYARLAGAVDRGAPDRRFLWPLELVHVEGQRSFGYVMPLRDDSFVGMRNLIAPPPDRVELTLAQRASVCAAIAHCFLELHASGLCYQDINFGNVFLNPDNADVLICDNDNVNINGAEASIYGTRKFMAPEVVRREVLPSTETDLFSMAVMFFYVLFGWHPLDGRREAETRILDAKMENKLYGTEPIFIFDPANNANGPVDPLHNAVVYRWRSLNDELRELFIRSFTTGLFSSGARVHEFSWRNAFNAVPSRTFQCANCGYENILDLGPDDELLPGQCGYCEAPPEPPPVLVSDKRLVVLEAGRPVSRDQLTDSDSQEQVAMIEAHPQRPAILGMRNLLDETWRVEIPGFSAAPIAPGKTVRLIDGTRIELAGASTRIVNPRDRRNVDG